MSRLAAPETHPRDGSQLVRGGDGLVPGWGEWIHVDADEELMHRLYFTSGFEPASAGIASLISLQVPPIAECQRADAGKAPRAGRSGIAF